MEFKIVSHGGLEYARVVDLRERVLRTPLGLSFTERELDEERGQTHFAVYDDNQLIACLAVVPIDDTIFKIRQMAVSQEYRRQGVGQKLLSRVTETLREKEAMMLYLHAREDAVAFYERSGFNRDSKIFKEVSIPHYRMYKNL